MRRMLIVDDEPDICECLHDFFSVRGFQVHEAFSGAQAMNELMVGGQPDVLLLDLRLPDAWGIDILKCVKRLYPATKIIVVSSMDQSEPRQQARACGAIDFVSKPFDFSETTWRAALASA